jgi:release factor glutamine methyltransferase
VGGESRTPSDGALPGLRSLRKEGRAALRAAGVPDGDRDVDLLLAEALGTDRVRLHIDPPPVTAEVVAVFRRGIAERARRVPMAYVLGSIEFYSREFRVDERVLVPRWETEHLVDAALDRLPTDSRATVLDVGTGSGCIAISIALERPLARVVAVDRSADALAVAVDNARRLGAEGRVRFLRADLLEAVRGPVDMVVSNPPYVAEGDEVDPETDHEPRMALYAGPLGLDVYRRLIPGAARVLRPGGTLLLETAGAGIEALNELCREAGLEPQEPLADLAGKPRVLPAERR